MNSIISVKVQGSGWLLNNVMHVPGNAPGNSEYEAIKQWLSEGNNPEPEFTEDELASIELNKKIQEAIAYLAKTDYITAKYNDLVTIGNMSKVDFIAKYKDIYDARDEARRLINEIR